MWKWYVYKLFDGDDVVYVGKGCGNRLRVSKKERGFNGHEVARFKSEADALEYEKGEIVSLKPRLNCSHIRNAPRTWDQSFNWILRRDTKAAAALLLLRHLGTLWFPTKEQEMSARTIVAKSMVC